MTGVNAFGQTIGDAVDGWTLRPRPERRPIEGRLCRLEPLDAERHAASLFAAFHEAPDARDWTYLPVERPGDLEAYRALATAQAASTDPLHFAVLDRATGAAVGTQSLMRIDPASGVIEVGHITFSPRLQRTTAATEALYLFARYVFDELGYRRFEWKCDSLNVPSRRAAERFGFVLEGLFRQAIVTKGRNRDTSWYAMTDRDWPVVRHGFERWLAPDNFDAAGRQLATLATCRTA